MSETLHARFSALVQQGQSETVKGRPFLPMLELESEMRYGLALRDGELVWARSQVDKAGQPLLIFAAEEAAVRFVELVEHDRDEVEDRLGARARALGIDREAAIASLPVVAIVEGLLNGRSAMFCRQALQWVRPTELRALRSAIAGVADDRSLPRDVRSLAGRLTVPEAD